MVWNPFGKSGDKESSQIGITSGNISCFAANITLVEWKQDTRVTGTENRKLFRHGWSRACVKQTFFAYICKCSSTPFIWSDLKIIRVLLNVLFNARELLGRRYCWILLFELLLMVLRLCKFLVRNASLGSVLKLRKSNFGDFLVPPSSSI